MSVFSFVFHPQVDEWPPKAIKAFGSLTGDKPLLMTVS